MGFFSRYRKRLHDRCKSPFQSLHTHVSKTPNFISFLPSSKSVVSLVYAYPDPKSTLSRKLHAPVRNLKFTRKKLQQPRVSSCCTSSFKMGNCLGIGELFSRYDHSKKDALQIIKYHEQGADGLFVEKDNVIDIDGDEVMKDVSDDSSIEEVDVRSDIVGAYGNVYEEKNGDFIMLDYEEDDDDDYVVPVYKKLHQSANKRDGKISYLRSDIEGKEKRLAGLRSRFKGKQVKKDLVEEWFTPLTDEEESDVAQALSNRNRRLIVVSHENSNIDITGEKMQCLRPSGLLNDEVINVYLALLKEREKREPEKFLKCHFFNTFFYKKLIGRGGYSFQSVQRWTTQKKLGYSLLECDKIFVPIHRQVHWCLAIINKKEEKIQYLDSLKGVDSRVLDLLARYYVDEVKDKSGKEIDISSWKLEYVEDLPEQMNGYDCGMFMIKYADFYSRNLGLCFSQEHMPYFRKRTAKELLRLRAD